MTAAAGLRTALIALFAVMFAFRAASADDLVNVSGVETAIDLVPHLKIIETEQNSYPLALPPDAAGNAPVFTLDARGKGTVHRWAVASLANPGGQPADLVIVVPHRGFTGSGINWPLPAGTKLVSVLSADGAPVPVLAAPGEDAFALFLERGRAGTIAFELGEAGTPAMTLWTRSAYESHAASQSFTRGAVIGIAGAFAAAHAMRSMLFGITPVDLPSFLGSLGILAAVAAIACAAPAIRASGVHPVESLRLE